MKEGDDDGEAEPVTFALDELIQLAAMSTSPTSPHPTSFHNISSPLLTSPVEAQRAAARMTKLHEFATAHVNKHCNYAVRYASAQMLTVHAMGQKQGIVAVKQLEKKWYLHWEDKNMYVDAAKAVRDDVASVAHQMCPPDVTFHLHMGVQEISSEMTSLRNFFKTELGGPTKTRQQWDEALSGGVVMLRKFNNEIVAAQHGFFFQVGADIAFYSSLMLSEEKNKKRVNPSYETAGRFFASATMEMLSRLAASTTMTTHWFTQSVGYQYKYDAGELKKKARSNGQGKHGREYWNRYMENGTEAHGMAAAVALQMEMAQPNFMCTDCCMMYKQIRG